MIVINLQGGLGNQLFQYAFGRRLSVESRREVRFDVVNGFRSDPYGRHFALDALKTTIVRAEPQDIPLGMSWPSPWNRCARAGWLAVPRRWRRVVYERLQFCFDQAIVSCAIDPAYYIGYWQNEGYFAPIQDLLRQEFSLRASARESVAFLMREMAKCRAVSVHIRCLHGIGANGMPLQGAREYHGVCSLDYYQRAIEQIGGQAGTVCYVFTDDLEWAKANLRLAIPCRYVADVCRCSDVEEMILMASCQHHVISNSSFSWWGAWLGRNPGKMVVAPKIWTRGLPEGAVDICPKGWVQI